MRNNPFEVYTSLKNSRSRKSLDWEESALDSRSTVEGFFDEERQIPAVSWMWALLLLCFFALGAKIFFLQVVQGSGFRSLSENNRLREQVLLAPRGIVRDRNGEILAQNTASFNLVAVPFDLPKDGLDAEVGQLAGVLKLDAGSIADRLKNINRASFQPVIVAQDISQDQSILFETRASSFVGFSVQQTPIRDYVDAAEFSHVLGYTGIISPDELAGADPDRYDNNDYIGKLGIEQQYERYLHGINGYDQIEVDAAGKLIDVIGENAPQPGNTLVLNIDKGLQEELYGQFKPGMKGAAVALDPRTGAVLALVSVPGFDNNLFAHGIQQGDYQALLGDKNLPLFDRAIAGTYPPGSTVKPMVATAALQEGVINENTVINDQGVLTIPNQYNPALRYDFRGWKPGGLGAMTVRSAIAMSSDIFFYVAAGGYPNTAVPDGLGPEKLAEYYKKFNLGRQTGIDLQGEKPGTVPTPEWKAEYFKDDPILSKWYLGDTYHIGIGQGDVLVTPLQVAEWTATIANDGTGYQPQIAQKVLDSEGNVIFENKPQVIVSGIADPKNIKIVQQGMRQTVTSGTAKPLGSLPITSAGKTGTSQFDGSDPTRTHAWFTAYAPYETPEIAITVLVEAGGEGNAAAEPIVQHALQWWAGNRYEQSSK